MTQHERIIEYMRRKGSITPMAAFTELGITKLATRIGELRKDGVNIRKVTEQGINRYGEQTHYVRYSLSCEPHVQGLLGLSEG